jgi:hypothetical protein
MNLLFLVVYAQVTVRDCNLVVYQLLKVLVLICKYYVVGISL